MAEAAAGLQTATAAITIVQLAYQTVLFIKRVRKAHEEANLLYKKTWTLFRLVKNIDARLHTRQQLRGPSAPDEEEEEIEQTIKESLAACRQCLLKLQSKLLKVGGNAEQFKRSTRAAHNVRFALNAKNREKQERELETHIQTLTTNLSLLQLFEHDVTQRRIDRLGTTIQRAVDHLDTIPHEGAAAHSPRIGQLSSETLVEQEVELLGIQSLRRTIRVARSVQSNHGSSQAPDARSIQRMEEDASSEHTMTDDDSEEALDEEAEKAFEAGMLGDDRDDAESMADRYDDSSEDGDDYPSDALVWERKEFTTQADQDYKDENWPSAERLLKEAISHGDRLEQRGHGPFEEQSKMRKRLADIYVKQEKYSEALVVIRRLLDDAKDNNLEGIRERANLYYSFANVKHLNYLKTKDRNRDAAVQDLNLAEDYAVKKSFRRMNDLLKQSFIDSQDPMLLECVRLVIRIFDDQGNTVKALAWRKKWFGTLPRPQSLTPSDPATTESEISQGQLEAEKEALLDTPGQTRLINSIKYNLATDFQELLGEELDVEERCERLGFTPIMHAASCKHESDCICATAIRKLKDQGGDVKATVGTTMETALHLAVKADNFSTVQVLLEMGADINSSAPNTPLSVAVKLNKPDMAKHLMDAGANTTIVDADNWTLIHHAVSNNSYETLLVLLQRHRNGDLGIDLNARCSQNMTVLMQVAKKANHPCSYELARALLEKGEIYNMDINATDGVGRSALYFAIESARTKNRENFAKMLLSGGAKIDPMQTRILRRLNEYPGLLEYHPDVLRKLSTAETLSPVSRRASNLTTISGSTTWTSETSLTEKSAKPTFWKFGKKKTKGAY